MTEQSSLSILKRYWGFDQFRPLQEEIIHSILLGEDTLALMPTGGGKSICFQIPAMMQEGICIVVSPLIALMKDQVQRLRKQNISAIAIYSGMSHREVDIALDNCVHGGFKFLYLAPERLYSDLVVERIRYMKVNLFAIDEAHCISQWGYDFRPSYLQLNQLREIHPKVPILALTATATPQVVADIQDKLHFRRENVLRKSFVRENLAYMALHEEDKWGRMLRVIHKIGGTGVVYVRNRRETQEVARFLLNHGVSADFYHAGLDMATRSKKQDAWANNQVNVIVATNAFGMGIDKANVRYVIHLDLPDSLEAYFQEAGRAGRDGKKAFPVLLYQQSDRDRLWKNLELAFPDAQFIKKVYHYLGNYFQVAYGAGAYLSFDFDLLDFAKKFDLDAVKVLSACKFLERDGWLLLSEATYIPSRFKFEIDYQELYKFQVQYAKFDSLIKAILRTYGGVFDFFVPINEYEFAKKLNVPYAQIVALLQELQKLEISTYLAKSDSPKIQYLQPRMQTDNLHIDTDFIASRRAVKETQVKAIYQYLDSHGCRSVELTQYFGEEGVSFCGQCDLCLKRAHTSQTDAKIRSEIKNLILNEPLPLRELIDGIHSGTEDARIAVLRQLVDQEIVKTDGKTYLWNAGF